MNKPILEDWFRFSGRRNRKSYILACLTLSLFSAVSLGLFFAAWLLVLPESTVMGLILMFISSAALVLLLVSALAISSQCIRDFGYSGVLILVGLIPYVGPAFSLAICFIPSDEGANKYGPAV